MRCYVRLDSLRVRVNVTDGGGPLCYKFGFKESADSTECTEKNAATIYWILVLHRLANSNIHNRITFLLFGKY